jgi:predicted enzyme related to lactoylglutathione lyase
MAGIARMRSVVLDCPDTRVLAEFYRDLLGWEITYADYDEPDGWAVVSDGTYRIAFQRAADHRPPTWPDPAVPQQFHLDFTVDDLDAAEADTVKLGAVKAPEQPSPAEWRVFLDPAGHPFCLCV